MVCWTVWDSIPNLMTQKLRGNPLGEEDGVKSIVKQALP